MRYSKTLLLITVCGVFSTVSLAQTFKIDEFRQVNDVELKTRVYGLFNHLNCNREARGHVIVYAAADGHISAGESLPLVDRIKQFVTGSPFHDALITVTYGGLRKTEAAEVYIVPKGSEAPEPMWTVGRSGGKTDAVLWSTLRIPEEDGVLEGYVNRAVLNRLAEEEEDNSDNSEPVETTEYNGPAYTVQHDSGPVTVTGETEPATEPLDTSEPETPSQWESEEPDPDAEPTAEELEEMRFDWIERDFAEAVAKRDGSHGVMILYADDQFYDIARLEMFVCEGRDSITARAGLDRSQIEVIFGGYRGEVQIEYYIVPEGGKEPESKPEER